MSSLGLRTVVSVYTLLTLFAWVSANSQTQPAGQVSRKVAAKSTVQESVTQISAPASTTCSAVPAGASTYEGDLKKSWSTLRRQQPPAANADNLSAVAKAYVKKAQGAFGILDNGPVTGDKILSALIEAAHQADILEQYVALSEDCSKKANGPLTGDNSATLVAQAVSAEHARRSSFGCVPKHGGLSQDGRL